MIFINVSAQNLLGQPVQAEIIGADALSDREIGRAHTIVCTDVRFVHWCDSQGRVISKNSALSFYLKPQNVFTAVIDEEYVPPVPPPSGDWFRLRPSSAVSSSVRILHGDQAPQVNVEYSTDNGITWIHYDLGTCPYVSFGLSGIFFRGIGNTAFSNSDGLEFANIFDFSMGGPDIICSGNIMSLLDYNSMDTLELENSCFASLFYQNTSLVDASELILPATYVAPKAYMNMFGNCHALKYAPQLPATSVDDYAYSHMFSNCWSLEDAPALPATTIGGSCYDHMFEGSLIKVAPALPATELHSDCYRSMFTGCEFLTSAPDLPATELKPYCYAYMFSECSALETMPTIAATTLADHCCIGMFRNCSDLQDVTELLAENSVSSCYEGMFIGCGFEQAPAFHLKEIDSTNCVEFMFEACDNLKVIVVECDSWNEGNAGNWVKNVPSWPSSDPGKFYNVKQIDIPTGVSGVPDGWVIIGS